MQANCAGLGSQTAHHKESGMSLGEIASTDRRGDFRSEAALVAGALIDFHQSIKACDTSKLAALTHPVWNAKIMAEGGAIHLLSRESILETIGFNKAMAADPLVSSIDFSHGRMAIARVDDWSARMTSVQLLLRDRASWVHVGELTNEAYDAADARFSSRRTESAILDVLQRYYRAVTNGDPATIDEIFHPLWQMKNHEGDMIVSEVKSAFIARIEAGAVEGYDADRQVSGVKIIAHRLAYVRVDRPSTPSTTSFFLAKCGDEWRITDKIWVGGRI